MRYLGNKESILENIINLLRSKNLLNKRYKFFDAFCGTGTVSDGVKNYYDIIINDNLKLATTFASGRVMGQTCEFNKLGFDPVDFFNKSDKTFDGFFSKNYSPSLSKRMYFNDFNAARIDYFRKTIEDWKNESLINDNEYCYLLGCLLESVSKVANVAGVYGAFLKKWDPRAVKNIKFLKIDSNKSENCPSLVEKYNKNINEIIGDVDCDILYLDPPYTKNKYTVQYHILETLIRNDNPELHGVTGCRSMNFASDNWSKPFHVEAEFEETIRKTKAKHIILSYSSDGIMSKEFISCLMKRYGYEDTFTLIEIPYKKYRNYKTNSDDEHYEYIFYIEKKPISEVIYYCPLNYMGGKSNVIEFIKPHLNGKSKLIDLMSGGFNVGINGIKFNSYYYNDTNFFVKGLVEMFKNEDTPTLLGKIEKIIKKYNLQKHSKEEYIKYRDEYNFKFASSKDKFIYLYTLILYGFQQQIRFNSDHEFNNPVGESGYNDSIKEKIVSFSAKIKSLNIEFYSMDFEKIESIVDKDSLVYIDPPYLITLGSYNDGKRGFNGWNDKQEERLIDFIDRIKTKNCKILISNILDYKGKENHRLKKWIADNHPNVNKITIRGREEVLVVYESII